MTEGQWLYLLVNMALDDEEELEKMCNSCKEKSKIKRCISCGEAFHKEQDINPRFDNNKFEEMKKKSIK